MSTFSQRTIVSSFFVVISMSFCFAQKSSSSAPEKKFSFTAQGGKRISASVYSSSEYGKGRKLIVFSPFLDKTDGNFYNASLQALFNIYGKHRGLFQLEEARTEYDPKIGGRVIYWYISNPRQRFYSFPIKDSATDKTGSIVVWIE